MTSNTQRAGPVLLIVASLIGTGISLYNYLAPLTGVNGTPGALLVVVCSVVLVLCGLALMKTAALTLRLIALLIALGALAAAGFLHEYGLMIALAAGVVGIVIDFCVAKGGRT